MTNSEPGWAATAFAWMVDYHIGDFASLAGLLIAIVGFAITIIGVLRSQTAAERAEVAAKAAMDSIRTFDAVIDFSSAISSLEEIKRLHRHGELAALPDRYAAIRKLLASVRASNQQLSDLQASAVQNAVANIASIEAKVEKAIAEKSQLRFDKTNQVISKDIDNLVVVLTELKNLQVGEFNG